MSEESDEEEEKERRKSRKKISERRKMRKSWNGKALMRAARKRTRIGGSWIRKSVNGKGHG